ncbi:MAG TPA: YidC/Oxa1 family insertase periplasmic-domain containing protein [Pirellulales bacterium]|nr:YidC/Oxa1 family insertase periplasmic-domain containing protein [Pirellulales bacterium]
MDKRFLTFLMLSTVVVIMNITVMWWMNKNRPPAPVKKPADVAKELEKVGKGPGTEVAEDAPDEKPEAAGPSDTERHEAKDAWETLGSADPESPYRMLVTFTSRGAAIERIELNSPRFHDLEDRSGYLGHLEPAETNDGAGCLVRVVGAGTPAARAGLQSGDIITSLAGEAISGPKTLTEILRRHNPGDSVELVVDRDGEKQTLTATLVRRPLEVIRPEPAGLGPELRDQLSFLLTLQQVGNKKISDKTDELPGLRMRTTNWSVLDRAADKPDEVSFEYVLEQHQLRVVKTYQLSRASGAEQSDINAPAYHLNLRIEVENTGKKPKEVAYRLDGPTGLPTEGWWYSMSTKIGHSGSPGVRDLSVARILNGRFAYDQVNAIRFAEDDLPKAYSDLDLVYAGVDAQYVAVMLIPQHEKDSPAKFKELLPLRVGPVPAEKNKKKLVDTSCRLISELATVEAEKPLVQEFQIFAGPKRPELLERYAQPYGLDELVYYGWFGWVSRPMLAILHFFYGIVGNYGLSIVMLTVLVRSCMFPLSRKQALNAAKMQELQPELKKLADKYKNPEERMKAQRDFFKKHNYHPLSGCLPALVQLPIFLGLYRSLAVDIELRQAPLISESVRWCSNLGAPDMLWYWKPYLPIDFFTDEAAGWLGPYLNVLPLVTISLFIVQQKMFLPPPTDEQAAMQQKMMQWMMVFMGVMFFKVASGLCLYFIASSLWGITERKLLPKPVPKSGEAGSGLPAAPGSNGSGPTSRKKPRSRK